MSTQFRFFFKSDMTIRARTNDTHITLTKCILFNQFLSKWINWSQLLLNTWYHMLLGKAFVDIFAEKIFHRYDKTASNKINIHKSQKGGVQSIEISQQGWWGRPQFNEIPVKTVMH